MNRDEVADRLEIADVLDRYAYALDDKDWETLRSTFADGATVDYRSAGGPRGSVEDALGWLDTTMSMFAITQHLNANRIIEIDGDEARVRSYVFSPVIAERDDGSLDIIHSGGEYEDRLVRTASGWRIAKRVNKVLWIQPGGRGQRGLG